MVTMHLKPKQPEKYNGNRDFQTIDNWIASVDSYFTLTGAEPPAVYHYLNTIFSGEAATWFRYTYRNTTPDAVTWEQVKKDLREYFITPNHARHLRDQWAYARQTGSVLQYHAYLAQLAMQIGGITDEVFIDKFIRGLKPNTRTELEFRDPKTIAEAVKWADTYNARYTKKDTSSYQPYNSSSYQEDNRGEPMQLDLLRTNNDDAPSSIQIDALNTKSQPSKFKKLSDAERVHLRSIGACFKCRKQGHMARECPSKAKNTSGNSSRQ